MKMETQDDQEERVVNQDDGIEWSSGNNEPCPADVFEFEFVEFRQVQHKEYGLRLILCFDTVDEFNDDGKPYRIEEWTSPSFSPKGLVRPMLTAFGENVDEMEIRKFRLSQYLNRRLRIAVEHEERTSKKTGQKYPVAVVGSFLPLRAKKRRDEGDDRQPVAAGARDEEREERKKRLREDE